MRLADGESRVGDDRADVRDVVVQTFELEEDRPPRLRSFRNVYAAK